MKSLSLSRCALSLSVAAIFLAGCGGSAFKVAPNGIPPAQVPAGRPTEAQWERWRSMILRVPDPGHGCLEAIYPERQWREIRCGKAPNVPLVPANGIRHATVGNGTDDSASPKGGHTTAAEGWFHNVTGVTSEYSTGSSSAADYYSLQLNTNPFLTAVCGGLGGTNKNCKGWEQFVFVNEGNTTGYDGSLFIQYWLIDYARYSQYSNLGCPNDWNASYRGGQYYSCFTNSGNADDVQSRHITQGLALFRLGGASVARSGYKDNVTLNVTDSGLYKVYGDNWFPHLSNYWKESEFNVFGDYDGNEAIFNAGSTIGVRTAVTTVNGTDNAPLCIGPIGGGFTGETNNLSIGAVGRKWPIKDWPAIIFSETNVTSKPKPECATEPGSGS
ncbi:MAG: hypothetical protein WBE30_09935 [Candidatus Cybelea sp.]